MTHYQKIKEIFEAIATMEDGEMMVPMKHSEIETLIADVVGYVEEESGAAWQRGIDQAMTVY